MTLTNLINAFSVSLSAPAGAQNSVVDNKSNIVEIEQEDLKTSASSNFQLSSFQDENKGITQPLRNAGVGDGANGYSVSNAISATELNNWLDENYPEFRYSLSGSWYRENCECGDTIDVTGAIPRNVNESSASSAFNKSEISAAINNAGVQDETSYGGCGPIAIMGILDYFAKNLGFNLFDPDDSGSRIELATKILKHTDFSVLGSADNTFVWPGDVAIAFNDTLKELGCNYLTAKSDFHLLFPGHKEKFLKKIKESIDNGIPVTLATGLRCGDGDFAEHYANIYGYDTWKGVSKSGDTKTKIFLKARLNFNKGSTQEYFCDADILDCAQIGIITYSFSKSYSLRAYDFNALVNSSGQGQYFFGPSTKSQDIYLYNKMLLKTERIRTSYIEDKYLVLSPNRKNAGTAFLQITFPHYVNEISFSANMWGPNEGNFNETFCLDYGDNGGSSIFRSALTVECRSMSTSKYVPNVYKVSLPSKVKTIRFFASHSNPSGDRNKGRICIDDIVVKFNNEI